MKNYKIHLGFIVILLAITSVVIVYGFINFGELRKNLLEFSTPLLAFLTLIYVFLTYFILKSNENAVHEQLRPYVIVTFPEEYEMIYFSIKNIGKRPAYNVNVTISEGLEEFQLEWLKGNYKLFLEQKFIAPNQEIKDAITDIGHLCYRKKKELSKNFEINITFFDSANNKYDIKYSIDLSSIFNEKKLRKNDEPNRLEEICNEFKKLNENIESVLSIYKKTD